MSARTSTFLTLNLQNYVIINCTLQVFFKPKHQRNWADALAVMYVLIFLKSTTEVQCRRSRFIKRTHDMVRLS